MSWCTAVASAAKVLPTADQIHRSQDVLACSLRVWQTSPRAGFGGGRRAVVGLPVNVVELLRIDQLHIGTAGYRPRPSFRPGPHRRCGRMDCMGRLIAGGLASPGSGRDAKDAAASTGIGTGFRRAAIARCGARGTLRSLAYSAAAWRGGGRGSADARAGGLLAHELHDVEGLCIRRRAASVAFAGLQRRRRAEHEQPSTRAAHVDVVRNIMVSSPRALGQGPYRSGGVTSAWRNCGIVGAIPWPESRSSRCLPAVHRPSTALEQAGRPPTRLPRETATRRRRARTTPALATRMSAPLPARSSRSISTSVWPRHQP